MRLTLRTLLAYLDDILDEQDAEQLKTKIGESEIATQLVQRIGQVGQKRLDAPHIDAEGIGADANSVAEYLDNTLPAEQVPDFEQACLDADMHLGEVAACHQILTLVLGEPAEISPRLKRSIHGIGSPAASEGDAPPADLDRQPIPSVTKEPADAPEDGPAGSPPIPAPDPTVQHPPVQVEQVDAQPSPKRDADEYWTKAPDYLVNRRRSIWKPIGIAVLILICLVIAGLGASGPLNLNHPLAQLILGTEIDEQPGDDDLAVPQTTVPQVIEQTPQDQDNLPVDELPVDELPVDELPVDELPRDDIPLDDLPTDPGPADVPPSDLANDSVVDDTDVIDDLPATSDPLNFPADMPAPAVDNTAEANLDSRPTVDPIDPPDPPVLEQPASVQPSTDEPVGIVPAIPIPNNNDGEIASDPDEPTEIAEGPKEIGRFLSEDQVLVRFNPTDETWQSLPPRASLLEDDLLMAFPIFRPQLMLATGMQLTLIGPAQAQLQAHGPGDVPNVKLDFGRATIVTFAQSGMTIEIAWGSQMATVTLADTSSSFAIEVDRGHAPGADLESQPPHTIVHVIATSGNIEWQMTDAEPIPLTAGAQLRIFDENTPQVVDEAEIPAWIEGRDARPRDPLAIRALKPFLTADRPVSLSLREQAEHRRQEVRSLAVCSLAYLGEFDPLLVALNDDRLYSYWSPQFSVLQDAASLDNETASRVRQAIEARHGEEGQQLFRMLGGYSPTQLAEGSARLLVDFLDHESSDFRVAAIENLRAITGIPSLYMPHYDERMRRKHVVTWRNKLDKGQIKYKDPPAFTQPDDAPVEP